MTKKILVVDDEFFDLYSIKKFLEADGFKVFPATSGVQALQKIKKQTFDLVLVDINMPTMSGIELLKLIKKNTTKDTKVAFISIVPKSTIDTSKVDGYIQKPLSRKSLVSEVKKIIGV